MQCLYRFTDRAEYDVVRLHACLSSHFLLEQTILSGLLCIFPLNFFINSDSNITQPQILTLKQTLTLKNLTLKNVNEKCVNEYSPFSFYTQVQNFRWKGHSLSYFALT